MTMKKLMALLFMVIVTPIYVTSSYNVGYDFDDVKPVDVEPVMGTVVQDQDFSEQAVLGTVVEQDPAEHLTRYVPITKEQAVAEILELTQQFYDYMSEHGDKVGSLISQHSANVGVVTQKLLELEPQIQHLKFIVKQAQADIF